MNVALSELPDFTCLPGRELAEHHTAGIIIGAKPRLHGAGLFRCAHPRLVEEADRRDGDLVHARRHARAEGAACREPVLPARRAGIAGWLVMGRSSRDGRRPDDRDGRPLCAELQARRCSAGRSSRRSISNAPSASSAATFSTARSISGRCSRRARCSAMRIIAGRCPGSTCAARARIRAAASPGCRGTMRHGKCCGI